MLCIPMRTHTFHVANNCILMNLSSENENVCDDDEDGEEGKMY